MKVCLTLIISILFSLHLFAEDPDTIQNKTYTLNEVVVESFKYDKDFRVLPISASGIHIENIQNRHIVNIKDISSIVPNLFMPDYGSKLTSPIYIRGIGSKINSPSVGLYMDGIPFFEKSAFDFDWNEIESIEVLRGPQGTLFGRNTMGGIINVMTKSPFGYQGTDISASYGNYANLNGTVAHYGNINNTFGYSISGNYNHSDGYFVNQYTGNKADDLNAGSGRIKLEWRIKPNLSLRLTNVTDYSGQGGYPYAVVDTLTKKTGEVNYNDYSSYKRTLSSTGASLIYSTDKFSLNSQTAFQYLSDKQSIDQDFSPVDNYFAVQNQKQATVSQELTVKSLSNGSYKWLFGAFAFHQNMNNEIMVDYKKLNQSTRKTYDTPTQGISFYHQSVLNDLLIERLALTLGLRYDYEVASDDCLSFINKSSEGYKKDDNTSFYSQLKFGQITPKSSLQYTFSPSQIVFISVSKGYKTGGFNTSFEREEDRSFDPEYSWNYEIGTKGQFLQHRIQSEISLFYIDWKNQQIYQTLPSGIGAMLKNAGRSESKGIEISLQGEATKSINVMANYGYTYAVFKEYNKSGKYDYAKKYLPLVPNQTFSLGLDYQIPVSKKQIDRLVLNVSYAGTGRLYWNEDNRISQPYYGLLGGKIAATKKKVVLSLWAKNITNADYAAFYFESMGNGLAQKGRPLTIGASVSVKL
jgi:outer membrane receptor protein involved in Fe transport